MLPFNENGNYSYSAKFCVKLMRNETVFEQDLGFKGPEFYIKSAISCLQVVNISQLMWGSCKTKNLWVQSGDIYQKRIKLVNTNY